MNFAFAGLAFAAALSWTGTASAQMVGIATANPGSVFHSIASAIASAANRADLPMTVQPATSADQYIRHVGAGGIEFGVANLQEVNYATEGAAWFEGEAMPELRAVGLIMPLVSAIFVRADSNIHSLADLRGRRMVDGYVSQQTILQHLDAIYATSGLTRADMRPVQVGGITAGADAFMSGDADGFIFAHGGAKVREADAAVGGIRALSIENSEEAIAAMREHWPTGYLVEIEPGPAYPGVAAPGHHMAFPQVVFTHAGVDEDTVYEMARVLHQEKAAMAGNFIPFNAFDPEAISGDTASTPYHPGALRYFEEAGLATE